jgi:hypothetical protein
MSWEVEKGLRMTHLVPILPHGALEGVGGLRKVGGDGRCCGHLLIEGGGGNWVIQRGGPALVGSTCCI